MKYIVTGSANLQFADGTSFSLTQGIHDDFPEEVKAHWAFSHHAEKLTDGDAAALLVSEADLKAQLAERDAEIADLKAQLAVATSATTDGKADKK